MSARRTALLPAALLLAMSCEAHECHFEALAPADGSTPISWQDGLNAALAHGDGAVLEFHGLELHCDATQPPAEPPVTGPVGCTPELAITRKGRFDVTADGQFVSSHNVFQEAVQAAVNSGGGAIRAPGYEVEIACTK